MWFIAIIVMTGAGNQVFKYQNSIGMEFKQCQQALKTFKSTMPSGGDAEVGIAAICTRGHLEYNSK